jgi:AcrR family transcriptional regulator
MTETSQRTPTTKSRQLAPAAEPGQRTPTTKSRQLAPAAEPGQRTPTDERRQRMPAAERRELVLEAAMTDFAAKGLAGTSTEDVARRAGISQPYLFRLFPTKKGLFIELIARCFQRVRDTFTAAADGLTGEEALIAMGDAYELLLEDRTMLRLQMQAYAACDDPEVRDATRSGFKGLWELTERLTGLPYQRVVDFFAVGMLMNVAAAMDLPAVDERWTSWCPKD